MVCSIWGSYPSVTAATKPARESGHVPRGEVAHRSPPFIRRWHIGSVPSNLWEMTRSMVPERLIALDNVHNFRDLGGYSTTDGRTIRWRMLFRADGLHGMSPADLEIVRELGLRTVIDLRSNKELDERGRFPHEDSAGELPPPVGHRHHLVGGHRAGGAATMRRNGLTWAYRADARPRRAEVRRRAAGARPSRRLPGGLPLRRGQGPDRAAVGPRAARCSA